MGPQICVAVRMNSLLIWLVLEWVRGARKRQLFHSSTDQNKNLRGRHNTSAQRILRTFLLHCSTYPFVDSSNGEVKINRSERERERDTEARRRMRFQGKIMVHRKGGKEQQAILRPILHEKEIYLDCVVDDKYSADSYFSSLHLRRYEKEDIYR